MRLVPTRRALQASGRLRPLENAFQIPVWGFKNLPCRCLIPSPCPLPQPDCEPGHGLSVPRNAPSFQLTVIHTVCGNKRVIDGAGTRRWDYWGGGWNLSLTHGLA